MNDTAQNGENLVLCLYPFFVFNILVPERVSKKIKTDTVRTTFKEAILAWLAHRTFPMFGGGLGGGGMERDGRRKLCVNHGSCCH
jgi:hypothetical protein